jgi:hypothetical protein
LKKVYSAQQPLILGHFRNLLVTEGIQCEVRIPFLAAAGGEVPPIECWSELWITNDEDLEKALGVINAAREGSTEPGASWKCSKCGEEIEGQFEECWQCGSARSHGDL